jgi:preprotein translocase subunit YajC
MWISTAYAQSAPSAGFGGGQLVQFLPIILMFVVLYFLMIRPQAKRAKETRQMIDAIQKGDEVITAGGLLGKITKVSEAYVTIEISKDGDRNVEVNLQKSAITNVLPKGSIKAI